MHQATIAFTLPKFWYAEHSKTLPNSAAIQISA
jgi:hypothetical protein